MNRRVLVIDDNPGIHEDLHKILGAAAGEGLADLDRLELELLEADVPAEEKCTYQLDSALAGEQALEMLIQALNSGSPYALAFVDMRMPPGWDGLETIEHLWQQDPLLQVVICTAYSDYSWDELEARVHNTDNLLLLSKPFDVVEIRQAAAAMTLKRHLAEAEAFGHATLQALAKVDPLGGQVAHHPQTLSLNEFLNSLPTSVQWRLELAESLPPIRVDPALLQQLLTRLVANAAESVGETPGSITLATGVKSLDRNFISTTLVPERPTGSYVWLACQGTGSGILEPILDPVFPGLMRESGGTLRVESEPDRGSTLWLYFPVEAPSRPGDQNLSEISEAPSP